MTVPLPHLLNSLTSSSPQLITSSFHQPFSPSHLLNYLNSSSPQLIAPPISYLNPVLGFFFSLSMVPMVLLLFESQRCVLFPLVSLFIFCCYIVVPMVLLLFESQRCVLFPLVSLFIFCCYIHLGALIYMPLYRVIVMFVVQSENIICHWEFSAHRAGLRLVNLINGDDLVGHHYGSGVINYLIL